MKSCPENPQIELSEVQSSISLPHLPAGSGFQCGRARVSPLTIGLRWTQVAAKVTLSLGLALLTMNLIAIRMYNIPSAPDPVLGDIHEPGKRFRQQVEGNGSGVFTSNCVRRASLPAAGQEPVLLILGDSFTEGVQVEDKDYFAHLIEQQLKGISVLAMGRPGYSVADYVVGAATFRKLFNPNWIIIQVGDADFRDDAWMKRLSGYAYFEPVAQTAHDRPTEAPQATGASPAVPVSLETVSSPVTWPGWLSSTVREKCAFWFPLVTFAYQRKSELEAWMADQYHPWFRAAAEPSKAESPPREKAREYPLDEEMKLLAEAYEEPLTLLYLPKFDPQSPSQETETEKELQGLAEKYRVPFVSLRKKFPELAAAGKSPYGFENTRFNWGHWNRYGHRAAAELLVEECQRQGVHR
jgi:hypothetical protein